MGFLLLNSLLYIAPSNPLSGRGRVLVRSLAPLIAGSYVAATQSIPLVLESSPSVSLVAALVRRTVFVGRLVKNP